MREITGAHFLGCFHDAGFQHQLSVILENNVFSQSTHIIRALQNRITKQVTRHLHSSYHTDWNSPDPTQLAVHLIIEEVPIYISPLRWTMGAGS